MRSTELFAADINPLRIVPGRIKRDPVGMIESTGKRPHLLRLSLRSDSAKNLDVSLVHLRHEEIPIGRSRDQAWIIQAARVKLHGKARQSFRPRTLGTRLHFRRISSRLRRERRRQILHRDLANGPWLFVAVVGKGRCYRRQRGSAACVFSCCRIRNFRLRSPSGSQCLHIRDHIPALLGRQRSPRRHPVPRISLGNEPENRPIRRRLYRAFRQRRYIRGSLAGYAVARLAFSRVQVCPGLCRRGFARVGVLCSSVRCGRAME